MLAKLVMMPHTVPNNPMKGATDEITARLGRPLSRRLSRTWAARLMASPSRCRVSPAVSMGT